MKKNFQITLPTRFQHVEAADSPIVPAIPMREATPSLWQTNKDHLLLQEFKGRYGYLYSYDTHLSDTLRIPLSISISDIHLLYLMEASAEVYIYTAAKKLICSIAPERARYLYLPEGEYILELPKGDSSLFGFYFDAGIYRQDNERPFHFIHDLIDLYREKSGTVMSSVDFEVARLTSLHVVYLCKNLRFGQFDNELFILKNLTDLIKLSRVKYHMQYSPKNGKIHIAEHIRIAIQKAFEIKGQDFNISDLVEGMKYSQNYYNSLHQQYYSMTLHQYKTSLVIEKAKTYLSLGHPPVNCAYECGFDNIDDFSRFFKKHTGLTPTQYIDKNT